MADRGKRCWTLEAARALVADVRARTRRAVESAEASLAAREAAAEGSAERRRAEAGAQRAVERWAREMEALGVEVKGLWLVDFDNGSGYYCWRWPEEELEYFHGYEDGFAGRIRIQ